MKVLGLASLLFLVLINPSWAQEALDLQVQIDNRQKALEEITQKERHLRKELYRLSQAIETKWTEIQSLKRKIKERERKIDETEDRLRGLEEELQSLQKRLKIRLEAFYRLGPVGFLNLLFSSDDVGLLLSRERLFEMILTADRRLANRYWHQIEALQTTKNKLLREKAELEGLSRRLSQELTHLESLREAKMTLLEAIQEKKELYEEVLQEIKAAQKDLSQIMAQIKGLEAEPNQPNKPIRKEDFPAYPLWPPVSHCVPKRESSRGPGVFFQAMIGNPIYAPAGGQVIYLGVKKAIGQVIIIEHSKGLRSLISGGGTYYKKVGDLVKKGELIGRVGAGGLGQEGVYYELRLGDIPLSPLEWLDKTRFR
ncbi:murein hydrolase activator EnvC family protein [Thermosulfuriphilus sp.]